MLILEALKALWTILMHACKKRKLSRWVRADRLGLS